MVRRHWSQEELDKLIRLRQAGASWLKIQNEIGIHRRTAKRTYENWERSQSLQELKEARKDVAAAEFRTHMESLVRLAGSLVTNLSVPSSPADMEKNTEQFFSWLWQQDLLQRYISSEIQANIFTMGDKQRFHIGDPQSYRREKELLFESLKVHTRGQVSWDILDNRWKQARDNCSKIVRRLPKETSEVVNNFLNQERQIDLLRSLKQESREDNPVKQMAEAVLREIWRAILQDKLGEEKPWFQTVLRGKGTPQEINIKSESETVFTFFGDTNIGLAKELTRICELAAKNLCKGDTVHKLRDEVRNMKKASEELREMLNPIRLRPMILRTRCDLCPA